MQRVLRYFQGTVRFSVDGGYPEKFLNRAAAAGVRMWDIGRSDTAIYASAFSRSRKKLEAAAAKSGVTLRILSRRGVPYKLKRYRRRVGIFAGAAVFLAVLFFFSSFIWTVGVTGNSETPTDQIIGVLAGYGVRPGAFPLLLNVKKIEQDALVRLPGLSWMHIDIRGSRVTVKVRERIYPPDIVPDALPCNIKAAQTGQILLIEAYQGQAVVKKGDAVQKGDLLVSGVIDGKNDTVRFVHAHAKIVAKVQRSLEVSVPYTQVLQVPTGARETRRTLFIFGLNVPLYFKEPAGESNRTYTQSRAEIFGVTLPVGVTTTVYEKTEKRQVTLTQSAAERQARRLLAAKEKTELSGAQILSRTLASKPGKTGYTLTGKYDCKEDIALSEEILIP